MMNEKITQGLLDCLTEQAKASPRQRMNLDLRNSPEDGSQRMLNAIEPGSPLPIHRHRKSSETVVCLRGRLVEAPDEQKAIRAASTIHHKMQDTVILSFLTDKLSNQEKIHRLLNECLDDSGRPLARRKSTSKKMKTFDINEFV